MKFIRPLIVLLLGTLASAACATELIAPGTTLVDSGDITSPFSLYIKPASGNNPPPGGVQYILQKKNSGGNYNAVAVIGADNVWQYSVVQAGGTFRVERQASPYSSGMDYETPTAGGSSVTQGTSPWVDNITQVAGSNIATGHGTAAGSVRVELPTDGTGVVGQGGTWTVQPGNTANTTPWAVNPTKVNGVAISTGAGATGTGTQRVGVAQDTTTIAGSAPGTAASPSANILSIQPVDGVYDETVNTNNTANASTILLTGAQATMGVQVRSLTGTGATVVFEGSVNGGTTWNSLTGIEYGTGVAITSITTDDAFRLNTGGLNQVRIRVSATGSGNMIVSHVASASVAGLIADSSVAQAQTKVGTKNYNQSIISGADGIASMLPTYTVYSEGYNAYGNLSTPTDMMCLENGGTNYIGVVSFSMQINSTTGTLEEVYFIKRSALDTGGSSSTVTPIKARTSDSASTATFRLFTAAPSLGTAIGTWTGVSVPTTVATSAPAVYNIFSNNSNGVPITGVNKTLILSPNEALCMNWNGATWITGAVGRFNAQWVEYTYP